MPCAPISDSDVTLPDVSNPGLAVPQLPQFNLDPLPNVMEDLLDLFQTLRLILPGGILRPQLNQGFDKNPLDAVMKLLQAFMPILMAYNFLMPILEMILCIIEVLCAINNPFKLVKALIRLFRVCIPDFLSLFPIFALILMIISLLLLILALILYLIQRILQFIEQIIRNIIFLADAVSSANADSIIAITIKLGDLLCIFQNLFVVLGVILLIIEVIKRLLELFFKLPPCDDGDNSDDGCCTTDVCPSFIKNNKEISANTGTLQYLYNVIQTSPNGNTTLRAASFQFYDANAPVPLAFDNIAHAFDLPAGVSQVFFPEGETYTKKTTPARVPYTVDFRFFYDPAVFGRTDLKGARFLQIKDCIVLAIPADGVLDFQNNLIAPFNGTLSLAGGTAFEDDGKTVMKVLSTDDAHGTLETVIFLPDVIGPNPPLNPLDGLKYTGVSYTFKINHLILVSKTLITVGCHPDVGFNKNFINNTIGAQLNANADAFAAIAAAGGAAGGLPDVAATQDCVISAINKFRTNVSIESANEMQTTVIKCLTDLQDDTKKVISQIIDIGIDPFKSDFTVDPPIQFTTQPIVVSVSLNESQGNNITGQIPDDIAKTIADKLTSQLTLGTISPFVYDGESNFNANINSLIAGNGTIKVAYNGSFIMTLVNPADTTQTPSTSVKEVPYTFVQSPIFTPGVRRDEGDVSRDGEV